ncbi:MAG: hypothetical protein KatS3mg032_2086 [Cyclobacteriaceae bacterium]|nr:MAG: hypothetical protein KatS3mg032_2086 [Cyclobacteriaceae bacterium]
MCVVRNRLKTQKTQVSRGQTRYKQHVRKNAKIDLFISQPGIYFVITLHPCTPHRPVARRGSRWGAPEGVGGKVNFTTMKNVFSKRALILLFAITASFFATSTKSSADASTHEGYKKVFLRQHCKAYPAYVCRLSDIVIHL